MIKLLTNIKIKATIFREKLFKLESIHIRYLHSYFCGFVFLLDVFVFFNIIQNLNKFVYT